MKLPKHSGALHGFIAAAAIFCAIPQGFAQTTSAQASQAVIAASQTPAWIKDPNKVMPMRKMTNLERRHAAVRNAERRNTAEAKKKPSAKTGAPQ